MAPEACAGRDKAWALSHQEKKFRLSSEISRESQLKEKNIKVPYVGVFKNFQN